MSKYDLYRNTICKEDDNDYILLFKDEESAKNVYDEFNQKDQQIKQLQEQAEELINNQNRKQWQDLAVKEFADKLFDKIDNNCIVAFNSINQESFIYPEEPMMAFSNFRHHLNQLLKERGIE